MSGNSDLLSVRDASVRDFLTGAFTRAYFISALEMERTLACESGKQFCLCLVDIDQLRSVNDQFGQAAGDAVLRDAAERVRSTLDLPQWENLRCLLARYDGDALVLLLPGCREGRAAQFAHVLRRRIGAAVGADNVAVTVTIAVAAHQIGESGDELLSRTESTLHLAKQFGSDCVETAEAPVVKSRAATVTRLPVRWHGPVAPEA